MKISVITVAYNSASTIAATLESVWTQAYGDVGQIEHIIVDGDSEDDTIAIVKEYEQKYRLEALRNDEAGFGIKREIKWISETDRGLYDAMNKGIAIASGDVIGILNSDDFYSDEHVLTDIATRFEQTGSDVVYADIVFVDQNDTTNIKRTWISGTGNFYLGWCPPHPSLYLTRATYQKLGEYRWDFKNVSDYDYLVRIFVKHKELKVSYLNRIVVHMRLGGESTRGWKSWIFAFKEIQVSLKSYDIKFTTAINLMRFCRKIVQLKKK